MAGHNKASRIQWQGRAWRLRVLDFHYPDGSTIERGFVDHPGSVVIVPILEGEVLMLRQYRLALDQWILELPAGTLSEGEDWLTCAKRELREETGFKASVWQQLGEVWPTPGLSNEKMALFLASNLEKAPLDPDPDEQLEVLPQPLTELIAMAKDGRLQDAKSIVAILRAATHFKLNENH